MSESALERFPPHVLREYSFIADGYRGALCDPRGNIAWLCAPRWHDDAVCASLIGGGGGYGVTPPRRHVWGGYYEPGTLVWRNRWVTTDSVVECAEALAMPAHAERLVLLRRIEALAGDAEVEVLLDLQAGFGRYGMRQLHRDDGVWTGRTGDLRLRWSGGGDAQPQDDGSLALRLVVPAGTSHDLVLELGVERLPDEIPDPDGSWEASRAAWQSAVPDFEQSVAPRDARHAYAVMRGLTCPGGGMVAAATMSLPERSDAGRNYDYRYVWLRDQAYGGLACAVDAPYPLLDEAVAVTTARLLDDGDAVMPAYTVGGEPLPKERTLDLPGYPGGADIVGNKVTGQFQLDLLGDMLLLFAAAARHDRLQADELRALGVAVDVIEKRWQEPDSGVWELQPDWWTQSRLSCVAGLRTAAAQLPPKDATRLATLADAVLAETSRRCLAPSGYWQRRPGDPTTDASLIMAPVRGALPASDPRTRQTLERVRTDLTEDGYVYRFNDSGLPLGEAEGAFVLCGFGMALATWQQGDVVQAFRWFERNRGACGGPGLMSEEYDVRQRQLRGNLPQGFVHALLLETSLRLAAPPTETAPPQPS